MCTSQESQQADRLNLPTEGRISGYDLARGLALISMILVNYSLALVTPGQYLDHWFVRLTHLLPCREAATFVVLAGIGTSLSAWRRQGKAAPVFQPQARGRLIRRALLLLGIGLLDSLLWNADILRFFGLYMLAGALLLTVSTRLIFVIIGLCIGFFPILLCVSDYETGWRFATMDYLDYGSIAGAIRGLFYNGHHPFFPWVAFYLWGMLLGRWNLAGNRSLRRRVLLGGCVVALGAEFASWALQAGLQSAFTPAEWADVQYLIGREPFPPMPLFVFQAGGTATFVIALCIELSVRLRDPHWLKPLVCLGQMSLTVYVVHTWIGLGALMPFGVIENSSAHFAAGTAGLFVVAVLLFVFYWQRVFAKGPLEWLLRRVAG